MSVGLAFGMIILVSLASLVGIFLIGLNEKKLDNILFILIAFAAGTIFAAAILDLIPEAIHHMEEKLEEGTELEEISVFMNIIYGFITFFVLERFLYWFHGHAHEEDEKYVCHGNMREGMKDTEENKPRIKRFAILNLVGDGFHNFLDGIIIMVAFLNNTSTGFAITIAVLIHELPQEIGDFGILLYGGFTKKKAILANLGTALISIFGGVFAYLMTEAVEGFNLFFLAFSGGGFLYLACSELVPEMLEEKNVKKSLIQVILFCLGVLMIYLLVTGTSHAH